jgi:hypothetical protein
MMPKRRLLSRRSFAGLASGIGPAILDSALPQARAAERMAAETQVDLNLVLAVDVSGSVNQRRFELQRDGYVAAFQHPRVLKAIAAGGLSGAIGVSMLQWTGPSLHVEAVPWSLLKDEASARAFAGAIRSAPRQLFSGGTSISGAIDYSVGLLERSPFQGGRRVVDISGDGANNRGRLAVEARDAAVARGITINGLPILELEPFLDEHYKNNVIGGPNAFMVVAQTFDEFADAILKKLVTEIASAGSPFGRTGF